MDAGRVAEIQPEAREIEIGPETFNHAENVAVEVPRLVDIVAEHEIVLETLQRHRAPRSSGQSTVSRKRAAFGAQRSARSANRKYKDGTSAIATTAIAVLAKAGTSHGKSEARASPSGGASVAGARLQQPAAPDRVQRLAGLRRGRGGSRARTVMLDSSSASGGSGERSAISRLSTSLFMLLLLPCGPAIP